MMKSEQNLRLHYSLTDAILTFYAILRRSKKSAVKLANYAVRRTIASRKRLAFFRRNGWVPMNVTFTTTTHCERSCPICYSSSTPQNRARLEVSVIDNVIAEASTKWGVYSYTLTGGEPLDESLALGQRHPNMLFFVYTHALDLLSDPIVTQALSALGNVFPIVSIKGKEQQKAGEEHLYEKELHTLKTLTDNGVVWGFADILTSQTDLSRQREVRNDAIERGAVFQRCLVYMPTGRGADWSLVPSSEQIRSNGSDLRTLMQERPLFHALDYISNPSVMRGCAAAALRYFEVTPDASIKPCVFFLPKFTTVFNLRDAYHGVYEQMGVKVRNLEDILCHDPLLGITRKIVSDRHLERCCPIIHDPDELKHGVRAYLDQPDKYFQYFREESSTLLRNPISLSLWKKYVERLRQVL